MRKLNLRNVDLNLLPVLDALLEEQCVTRASHRINLSQSATSAALNRIRHALEDPILVREGNLMRPTPQALALKEPLKLALDQLSAVLETIVPMNDFEGDIRISAAEYVALTTHEPMQALIKEKSPGLTIKLGRPTGRNIVDQLKADQIDFAMGDFSGTRHDLPRAALYEEAMVVAMRREHPANVGDRITLDDLARYEHVVITDGDIDDSALMRKLQRLGAPRRTGAELASGALIQTVLVDSDLLCISGRRSMELRVSTNDIVWLDAPIELGSTKGDIELVWHPRIEQNPALVWFRDTFIEACRREFAASATE